MCGACQVPAAVTMATHTHRQNISSLFPSDTEMSEMSQHLIRLYPRGSLVQCSLFPYVKSAGKLNIIYIWTFSNLHLSHPLCFSLLSGYDGRPLGCRPRL